MAYLAQVRIYATQKAYIPLSCSSIAYVSVCYSAYCP